MRPAKDRRGSRDAVLRVLAVGQTPPPYGGQAIAIESFVHGHYDRLQVTHVRMGFSSDFDEVGRFSVRKLAHLLGLIPRILWHRVRARAEVLYYPPAGPDLVPVVRDLAVLSCTRWAFRYTVFHFHAAGLSDVYPRLPRILRPLFRLAYGHPALAITPSELNPPDGAFLGAPRSVAVPNGVPDQYQGRTSRGSAPRVPVLLYVGVLRESKGLLVLVEACRRLWQSGRAFHLHLMGSLESAAFADELSGAIDAAGLTDHVHLLGTLTGAEKTRAFLEADVFCYPTHFESETFGLGLVEAMQFELPVVATRWRGVPSVVVDRESGFLVPTHDPGSFAERVAMLLDNPATAERMGRRGREVYLQRFTEGHYREGLQRALLTLVDEGER